MERDKCNALNHILEDSISIGQQLDKLGFTYPEDNITIADLEENEKL